MDKGQVGVLGRTALVIAAVSALLHASPAQAYSFDRTLQRGARGSDVVALEMRIAGWFPARSQRLLRVDHRFGRRTTLALKGFQRHFGLAVDGVAGPQTFAALARLDDNDGSTRHFSWKEFTQHKSSSCSSRANRYAGTFHGGPIKAKFVKRHIRYVMWRLEAIRAKARSPIIIESGFRSVAYNACIGGGTISQHMYGYAADFRMPGISAPRERRLAKRSQFYGIGCYSSMKINHVDLRMENDALPSYKHWWWPDTDGNGRHLSDDGGPCWGE